MSASDLAKAQKCQTMNQESVKMSKKSPRFCTPRSTKMSGND